MNFPEAMFYENHLTSDFHTLLFQDCLPTRQNGVENRDEAHLGSDNSLKWPQQKKQADNK